MNEVDANQKILESAMNSFMAQQDAMHEAAKSVTESFAQVSLLATKAIVDAMAEAIRYGEEYGRVLSAGLANFNAPAQYDSTRFTLDARFKKIITDEVEMVLDDFKKSRFGFLSERLIKAHDAYKRADYESALFFELSVIDGMLTDFLIAHNDVYFQREGKHPSFDDKFSHFIEHYKNDELFVESGDLRGILNKFFEHRHQIMHGGRRAFFDENLSVISFGIFVLVFESIQPLIQVRVT
jgi:hypothetical protein